MWLSFTKLHFNTTHQHKKWRAARQHLWMVLSLGWIHPVHPPLLVWLTGVPYAESWTIGLQLPDVLFHLYQDVNILFIHFLHHTFICQNQSYTLFCVTVHLFIQFTFLMWYGMQQLKMEKAPFGFDLRCIYDLGLLFDHELVCGLATVS